MSSYTKDELAQARRDEDVSAGVAFLWELAGPDGASFILLREPHHTDEQIDRAKRTLHNDRDVVGPVRVWRPE